MQQARNIRNEFGVLVGEGNDVDDLWRVELNDSIPSQMEMQSNMLTNVNKTTGRIL